MPKTQATIVKARVSFSEALEEAIAPWVVDKYKSPGATSYKVSVAGEEFYVLTNLSALPSENILEFFNRYQGVLETLFNLEPNTMYSCRWLEAAVCKEFMLQLLKQTRLIPVKAYLAHKKLDFPNFYKQVRRGVVGLRKDHLLNTVKAAEEITQKYFYTHFKLYYDGEHIGTDRVRVFGRKAVPDGVHISLYARPDPPIPVTRRPKRGRSSN